MTFVVNFDLPVDKFGNADCETYLHRIGRCGRFGKTGISINLIDSEESYKIMKQIQDHFCKFCYFAVAYHSALFYFIHSQPAREV